MEDSKLPFKIDSRRDFLIFGDNDAIVAEVTGEHESVTFEEAVERAEFIKEACNSHATLKARSELFDDYVAKLEQIALPVRGRTLLEAAMDNAVAARDFLSKAKALKGKLDCSGCEIKRLSEECLKCEK